MILGEVPIDVQDDTTIIFEVKYSVNTTKSVRKYVRVYTAIQLTFCCMLIV